MATRLLDPKKVSPPADLLGRSTPESLFSHQAGADLFVPGDALVDAINVSLALGAPLLLTGEPGTGKTQVAFYVAKRFGLNLDEQLLPLYVRSTSVANDLLYHFDAVAWFREAQTRGARPQEDFVKPGPLWKAYDLLRQGRPAVVLIDEIDKAPRDFPNDLLNVLHQHRFFVPEYQNLPADRQWIQRPADRAPPVVIITSNSERRLPEPFLRRCVFHHIELDEALVQRAVDAHRPAFANLTDATVKAGLRRFFDLRALGLRKPPATSEFLWWLAVLSAGGYDAVRVDQTPLADLPALSVLVKDTDDLERLR